MKGVVFHGPGKVTVEEVPEPKIQEPTDAILRITTSTICGTDIRILWGEMPLPPNSILGHECVGIVQEVGSAVQYFQPGQRVVTPFSASCGVCYWCKRGLLTNCEKRQVIGFGQLPGAQAQYVRVPMADTTLEPLPETVRDEQGAFLSDVLSASLAATERAEIRPGDVVAIVGAGPTGLVVAMCARLYGPSRVLVIDHHPYRLAKAQELGAVPINFDQEDPTARVRDLTHGRGANVVFETAGRPGAVKSALGLVHPWGTLVTMGFAPDQSWEFPRAFGLQHISWRPTMVPPVKRYIPRAIELISQGVLDPSPLANPILSLSEAPRAYEMWAQRQDNTFKVILKP